MQRLSAVKSMLATAKKSEENNAEKGDAQLTDENIDKFILSKFTPTPHTSLPPIPRIRMHPALHDHTIKLSRVDQLRARLLETGNPTITHRSSQFVLQNLNQALHTFLSITGRKQERPTESASHSSQTDTLQYVRTAPDPTVNQDGKGLLPILLCYDRMVIEDLWKASMTFQQYQNWRRRGIQIPASVI